MSTINLNNFWDGDMKHTLENISKTLDNLLRVQRELLATNEHLKERIRILERNQHSRILKEER
jgi:hypothetical protein